MLHQSSSAICRFNRWSPIVSLCLSSQLVASQSAALQPLKRANVMIINRLLTRQLQTWSRSSRWKPVLLGQPAGATSRHCRAPNSHSFDRRCLSYDLQSSRLTRGKIAVAVGGLGIFVYGLYLGYNDYLDLQTTKPFDLEIPSVPFPSTDEEFPSLQNRRVVLRGRFDHKNEVYIGPRKNLQVPSGQWIPYWSSDGYYVLTPFILSDSGRRILVNRGWISNHRIDPAKRSLGQIEGETELNAYVTEQENLDVITDTRATLRMEKWAYKDVQTQIDMGMLSRKLQIDPIALFIADKQSTLKNGPVGGQIFVSNGEFRFLPAIFMTVIGFYMLKYPFF